MNDFPWGNHRLVQGLWIVILALSLIYLGYFLNRQDFYMLMTGFSTAFLSYYAILRGKLGKKQIISIGIGLRLLLIFAYPTLSDDYFRFIWDGLLSIHGVNPFSELPQYYIEHPIIPELTHSLFESLNSPTYYSVYPPICQLVFAAAAKIGMGNAIVHVIIIRLFILLAEWASLLGLLRLLKKMELPEDYLAWYAFNPIIIIELTGNLHSEAFMIAGVIWGLYFIQQDRWVVASFFLSIAILAKLIPLMLLPSLLIVGRWKKVFSLYLMIGLICGIAFLPFINQQLLENIGNSLNLYFQRFEFNASIYYIIRWIGYEVVGYNIIEQAGIWLSAVTTVIILIVSFSLRSIGKLPVVWLWIFTIHLLGSSIVHPWYMLVLIPLGLLSNRRFPLIWSFSILLSYGAYQTSSYTENLGLVAISYSLVIGYAIWESIRPSQHTI